MQRVPDSLTSCCARWLATALCVALCSLLGGCNIVGPIAAVAAGPPTVPARYTLADVPTVVFVDDRSNLLSPASLRRLIADTASQQIMSEELVTMTISPQDAILMASRVDRASDLMNIEEIGRAVGAEQVIYVEVTMFSASSDGYTPVPTAGANVKVIDVKAKQRVFPGGEQPGGWPVKAQGTAVDPSVYASRPTRLKVFQNLAERLGIEVAKVFYKHEVKELGSNLR